MPKIGMRMVKTAVAVFLCFMVDIFRQDGVPFYSAIAAVLCMQSKITDSKEKAKSRIIATCIGGLAGIIFVNIEQYVVSIPIEWIRYFMISLCLIPIIYFTVVIKKPDSAYLSCVVFMCITVAHVNDSNGTVFALNRILDTVIGIVISLGVNQFHFTKPQIENLYVLNLDIVEPLYKQNMYQFKKSLVNHPNTILYSSKIPAILLDILQSLPLQLPIIILDGATTFDIERKMYISSNAIANTSVIIIQKAIQRVSVNYFCYELNQEQIVVHHQDLSHPAIMTVYEQTKQLAYMHYFHHQDANYRLEHQVLSFWIIDTVEKVQQVQSILQPLDLTMHYQVQQDAKLAILKIYSHDVSITKQVECIKKQYHLTAFPTSVFNQEEVDFKSLQSFFKGDMYG